MVKESEPEIIDEKRKPEELQAEKQQLQLDIDEKLLIKKLLAETYENMKKEYA